MQSLLTNIELDVQELKYLVLLISEKSDQRLYEITKRRVRQLEEHCRLLNEMLQHENSSKQDYLPVEDLSFHQEKRLTENSFHPIKEESLAVERLPHMEDENKKEDSDTTEEIEISIVESFSFTDVKPILGDAIKKGTGLVGSLSLNDSFRYSQELFSGDLSRMSDTLKKIEQEANSLEDVLYIMQEVSPMHEENETATDFMEWIKVFFDR